MGNTNRKINPPTPPPPPSEIDPLIIQELLSQALQDFKNSQHILCQAEPLINLLRIRVRRAGSSAIPILTVDGNNKAMFVTDVPDSTLENTMFFQVTFLNQPGQQYEHCFLTSNRRHVLYLRDNYVLADPITGPLNNHDMQHAHYLFHHSSDSEVDDLHTNCLIHPVGTVVCSLEYDQSMNAYMGCNEVRMELEKLGSLNKETSEIFLAGQ